MISIITATYNRGYLLSNLYNSLLRQTNRCFEWIVVDDGSTDNTKKMLTEIQSNNNDFSITYVYQENGGKHRAINRGVQIASGDFCFIVDSDDYLLDDAIEKVVKWSDIIINDTKIAGISGLRIHQDGSAVCEVVISDKYIDAKNTEREKLGLNKDCAEVYKTMILKKYPFPEFEGENFISEVSAWNRIALDGYLVRWYFEPIYVCEYLEDGLTNNINNKLTKNYRGALYVSKLNIKCYSGLKKVKEIGFITNILTSAEVKLYTISKALEIPGVICKICGIMYRFKHKLI